MHTLSAIHCDTHLLVAEEINARLLSGEYTQDAVKVIALIEVVGHLNVDWVVPKRNVALHGALVLVRWYSLSLRHAKLGRLDVRRHLRLVDATVVVDRALAS